MPTVALIVLCYAGLAVGTTVLPQISLWLAFPATTVLIAFHSSLQHEALHGHPTRNRLINEALVFFPVGLFIPYRRFRDLHMAHHHDEILTDPYDDPESNYIDPKMWVGLARWHQGLLRLNNTLAGRILLGPALSLWALVRDDVSGHNVARAGVANAWLFYAIGLVPVVLWVTYVSSMPIFAYILAAYLGFGLLKIRTYLEHRANSDPSARSVVIEDRGPLAFLFLNNNFHCVHHRHPGLAWYRLPGLYFSEREQFLHSNGGYVYPNYREVFAKYFFHAKDPVAHPLRPGN